MKRNHEHRFSFSLFFHHKPDFCKSLKCNRAFFSMCSKSQYRNLAINYNKSNEYPVIYGADNIKTNNVPVYQMKFCSVTSFYCERVLDCFVATTKTPKCLIICEENWYIYKAAKSASSFPKNRKQQQQQQLEQLSWWLCIKEVFWLIFFSFFVSLGERAMSPAQSEDSGLAADRGTTYATISLPRENAQAMGIVFLGK